MHECERSNSEIAEFFGFALSTVKANVKDFQDWDGDGYDPEQYPFTRQYERPRRLPEKAAQVCGKVHENPATPLRQLARETGTSVGFVSKVVKQDLSLKSYKYRERQFLSENNVLEREIRSREILNEMKRPRFGKKVRIFFSDEKIFTVERTINRQNDRYLAQEPEEVPIVQHQHHPKAVMALCVVSSSGEKMEPVFFEQGHRLNAQEYLDALESKIVPWMKEIAGPEPFFFQQDGAPAHTANIVKNYLKSAVPAYWAKSEWPPCSPDLNPLDYFFWGVVAREVGLQESENTQVLKIKIGEAIAKIEAKTVISACRGFRGRLERCVAAGGRHFE